MSMHGSMLSRAGQVAARNNLRAMCIVAILLACFTSQVKAGPYDLGPEPTTASDLGSLVGLRQHGLDVSLWGWLAYTATSQSPYSTYWSSELELDVTQTIGSALSLGIDWEFVDYNDEPHGDLEQAFVSILLSKQNGIVLTIGKFNSPVGAEPHDFWDRYTGTPSLLFRAQPQDMRGVMLTAPIGNNITLRPFVISGISNEDSITDWPTAGVMGEYQPNDKFDLAATAMVGSGIKLAEYDSGYGGDDDYEQAAYENLELTDAWSTATFRPSGEGELLLLEGHAKLKPRNDLTLVGEVLYGSTRFFDMEWHWWGVMGLANFDIDDRLRMFGMWSYLDDGDWVVYPDHGQIRNELSAGFAYKVNKYVELRIEYRRDITNKAEDVDSVSAHLSFGY